MKSQGRSKKEVGKVEEGHTNAIGPMTNEEESPRLFGLVRVRARPPGAHLTRGFDWALL